jgi:hypothetical protein
MVTIPAASQAASIGIEYGRNSAIKPEVMKIPDPITEPTTREEASKSPMDSIFLIIIISY